MRIFFLNRNTIDLFQYSIVYSIKKLLVYIIINSSADILVLILQNLLQGKERRYYLLYYIILSRILSLLCKITIKKSAALVFQHA